MKRLHRLLAPNTSPSLAVFAFFLYLALLLSYSPRLEQLRQWEQKPEQYFAGGVPSSGLDSYYWFRMARSELTGELPGDSRDPLRNYPDGASFERTPAMSWLIAKTAGIFDLDPYRAGIYVNLFLSCLFILPLSFYFFRTGYPLAGVLGGMVGALSPAYFYRSNIGRVDTDGGNLFFAWLIPLLLLHLSPRSSIRANLLVAALAGLASSAFYWWYGQAGFLLLFGGALVATLVAQRFDLRSALILIAAFVLFANPLRLGEAVQNASLLTSDWIFAPDTVSAKAAGIELAFPNVALEISELERMPVARTLAGIVRHPLISGVGLLLFVVMASVHWRRMLPLTPVLAIGLLGLARSYRFTMYLAPFVGIGYGYLWSVLYGVAPVHRRRWISEAILYACAVGLLLAIPAQRQFRPHSDSAAPIALISSLQRARTDLPQAAIIATSWELGYLVSDLTGAATLNDGGVLDSVAAQLFARAITSDDPLLLVEILSFLANYGEVEIAMLLEENNRYPDLLREISARYRSTEQPLYLLLTDRMAESFPYFYATGHWDFETGTGPEGGYEFAQCQRHLESSQLRCSGQGGQPLEVDLQQGSVNGRPVLRRAVFLSQGRVRQEREFSADGTITLQIPSEIEVSESGASFRAQFMEEEVFQSNYNQMHLLGRIDTDLLTEVGGNLPAMRLFRLETAGDRALH